MRDTITGCPERALEPPERADQERLNRLQDMREAETAIGLYLEDYKHLFVLEHRLVAEQKYGRKLTSSDIVHHIDGNKTNNNPENIVVLTRSEHAKLHNGLKKCNKRRNTSA